jgi:hypothetical protein
MVETNAVAQAQWLRVYKRGRLLFPRIWRLLKPYWAWLEAWPSWIWAIALMALALVGGLLTAYVAAGSFTD